MSVILSDEEGVVCSMDNMLIIMKKRLEKASNKLREANVTLNVQKWHFSQPSMKFLGQLVNKDSIKPDLTSN